MTMTPLTDHRIADLTARYLRDADGRVGLMLFPTSLESRLATRRTTLRGEPAIDLIPGGDAPPAIVIDPLAHVKIVGDSYPGAFAQGRTMRCSESNDRFRFAGQHVTRTGQTTRVITTLAEQSGLSIEHTLSWTAGDAAVEIRTAFTNGSKAPVTLEMLTSFSIGGITPFHPSDAPGRLRAHRFRSVWSAEGRLQTESIEQLHLERSWSGAGLFSERFGQVGSMPVRGWFPFVAVEDIEAGVTWGAQLAWAGSWQMEIARQHDDVCLSGGQADREFGHWMKTLAPGETYAAPAATLTCAAGGLDDVCDRLTALHKHALASQPKIDADLPVIFNEWCTTWGDPQHDKVLAIADRLKGSGVRYLVIDAGWYKTETSDWGSGHGDWVPSKKLFSHGLAATAAAIRERGLVPGLWYEMETVGSSSEAFQSTDLLLQRDRLPLTVRSRRFWDLSHPQALAYLEEKVIDLLDQCGFGYLKVDYNETIGLGCDHPDSIGEGLRRQIDGVYRIFDRIRERLPELVVENCSSGGHRLEPSMLARTAMSSFSDAHELVEIPIIAANLHRLMLPQQSQIWAVLHAGDSDRRLAYSLAATFLGRMCLSGEIAQLSDPQWAVVQRAIDLYPKAAPVIRDGVSRRFESAGESWRHPHGWQGVRRISADRRSALVVVHGFEATPPELRLPLGEDPGWKITDTFDVTQADARVDGAELVIHPKGDFFGAVLLLHR
ncbi:MAG: alpha-galactosidase [Tepidisphaeraceae bacterium]